ncbi:MAG: orotidine 5'-phosphate decarboxylase [archaeon]|nr:MAG: orotidine 5'-phosphate decarboxylase [archaeon]
MANRYFTDKYLARVEDKNTVLCAGLDPADYEMGRGEKGLGEGIWKKSWALSYLEAVAPYCAAVKPNIQYWQGVGDIKELHEVEDLASSLGLAIIEDRKLADIGSTNDAGMFFAAKGANAVTLAPYAGNIAEAAEMLEAREIGGIAMCLMSNPQYEREKRKWVPVSSEEARGFNPVHIHDVGGSQKFVEQYIYLADQIERSGLAGLVIGAPSEKNHLTEEELKNVRRYITNERLILVPGVGAQGGGVDAFWKDGLFGSDRLIVNVGRGLMFPQGSKTTPREQASVAKHFRDMLNEARKAA